MGFEGLGELAAFIFGCIAVVVLISFLVGGFILRRFFKKWSVILPLVYFFLVLLGMIVFFGVDLGAGPIWVFVLMVVGLPFTLLALVAPGHEISSHIGTLLVVITGTLQYFLLGWIFDVVGKKLKKMQPSKFLRRLWAAGAFFWIGAICVPFGLFLYDTCVAELPSGIVDLTGGLFCGCSILGSIFGFILLYRCWAVIQDGDARTSPKKAVVFCFIPIFNIYWLYVAHVGLAKELNGYCKERGIDKRVSERLALSWFILLFCSIIPFVIIASIIVFVILMGQFTNVGMEIVDFKATADIQTTENKTANARKEKWQPKSLHKLWVGFSFFWISFLGLAMGLILHVLLVNLHVFSVNGISVDVRRTVLILKECSVVAGTILGYILLYRCWVLIQDGKARTSPGRAVGFCFIPIFNLYWIYVSYIGLAKDMNAYCEERQVDARVSERLARSWFAWVLFGIVMCIFGYVFSTPLDFYFRYSSMVRHSVVRLVALVCTVLFVILMRQFTKVGMEIIGLKNGEDPDGE